MSSPLFSSHLAPSEHLLPSSQVAWSWHSLLVHPGVPLARQRQLLQPSGLQESPSWRAAPELLSTPQLSSTWGIPCTMYSPTQSKDCLSIVPLLACSLVCKFVGLEVCGESGSFRRGWDGNPGRRGSPPLLSSGELGAPHDWPLDGQTINHLLIVHLGNH